eukprot:scaffold13444_cov30-Tisochrysis_lutea.AAC.4
MRESPFQITPSQSKMKTSTLSRSSAGTSSFLHRPASVKETAPALACREASEVETARTDTRAPAGIAASE